MISTALITFNRLAYTQSTIESYLDTITVPYELIVVDNASTDGTREYLTKLLKEGAIQGLILNDKNYFPGHAVNQGFEKASKEAQFLHRSDNDLLYQKGWDKKVLQVFQDFPKCGQVGLINELYQLAPSERTAYEKHVIKKGKSIVLPPVNPLKTIGGPCVIKKEVWDKGLRFETIDWQGPINEDSNFSKTVREAGYEIYSLYEFLVLHMGYGDIEKFFEYYFENYQRRGQLDWFAYRLLLEKRGKIKKGQTFD